ncbi:MAG: DUF4276 family protein [Cyclobacteriaceae bacterium]
MKIGLVGEHPNDSDCIENLLSRYYDHEYFKLIRQVTGSQLDEKNNTKLKRQIRLEYEWEKPTVVIFIRDLDATRQSSDYQQKRNFRNQYFADFRSVVDGKALFLLHIYELEALLLADLDTVNDQLGTQITIDVAPEEVVEPKEWLEEATEKKYNSSKNPRLFKELDLKRLTANCGYFRRFIKDFETQLN